MEVAAAKGLPVLKYHLLPRTKGFTTAVKCLRGTAGAAAALMEKKAPASGFEVMK
ncbi:1-acyl-sn-glycerol-3-phosphate acyltransferase gamma [Saguinus oedipus]|uniref:1-acyl-sn-glycerol-3-phosphate acyltransferase gamma n=1 Tax=Saguinus oedipus TaxID=9490 RepID=A0ABQ9TYC0_SAGOE|nr:1-acyl-sn-glycerol-3-phosphate acyltransferase gamma [Saguinus oedipus]